jgi:CBS domain-containing protein
MLVRELMTADPVTTGLESEAKSALGLLADRRVTMLPVVDAHGRLCGVVAEGDLLRDRVEPDQRLHERPLPDADQAAPVLVVDVMTTSAHTVTPDADVADAVATFVASGVKSLPVVDKSGRLVGVLSRSDVVRAVARSDEALELAVDDLFRRGGLPEWSAHVRDGIAEIRGTGPQRQASLARALARTVTGITGVRVRNDVARPGAGAEQRSFDLGANDRVL